MFAEHGLVLAVEDRVRHAPAQAALHQRLPARVGILDLGSQAQEELPQVDVHERAAHVHAVDRRHHLVGRQRLGGAAERGGLQVHPSLPGRRQQVGPRDRRHVAVGDPIRRRDGTLDAAPVEEAVGHPPGHERRHELLGDERPAGSAAALGAHERRHRREPAVHQQVPGQVPAAVDHVLGQLAGQERAMVRAGAPARSSRPAPARRRSASGSPAGHPSAARRRGPWPAAGRCAAASPDAPPPARSSCSHRRWAGRETPPTAPRPACRTAARGRERRTRPRPANRCPPTATPRRSRSGSARPPGRTARRNARSASAGVKRPVSTSCSGSQ